MTPSERSEGGTNPSLKKVKPPSTSRSSSKKKVNTVSIRRSERIQNSTPLNFKIQNVIEEINLSESDKEDELPTDHEKSSPSPSKENGWSELMMGTRRFEAKIDYILKLFETHGHTLDSIKTEVQTIFFLVLFCCVLRLNDFAH